MLGVKPPNSSVAFFEHTDHGRSDFSVLLVHRTLHQVAQHLDVVLDGLNDAQRAFVLEVTSAVGVFGLKSQLAALRVTDVLAALSVYSPSPSLSVQLLTVLHSLRILLVLLVVLQLVGECLW